MPYGLIFSSGTWNVRVTVPQNVLHVFGRTVLWRTLQTRDYADAKRAAPPIHALFKRQIADARQKLIRPDASSEAVVGALHKAAMVPPSKWSAVKDAPLDTVRPPWQVQSAMAAFRRARDEPDGWKAIPEFDQRVVNILAQGGLKVRADDPIIAEIRQIAAEMMMLQVAQAEEIRKIAAHRHHADQLEANSDLGSILGGAAAEKPLPEPSLSIQELFDRWISTVRR